MTRTISTYLLWLSLISPALPQNRAHAPSIESALSQMRSRRWAERGTGLDEAIELLETGRISTADVDQLHHGIIQLMIMENALNFPPDGEEQRAPRDGMQPAREAEGEEYYATLISAVADMNDERAIPALAGSPESIATEGLLRYGDKALEPLFQELRSPNALVRADSLSTIISFWDERDDPVLHRRIRQSIQSALADPVAVVRSSAVDEISCLDDRKNFISALEKLAESDPANYPGRMDDGVDGDVTYPVRYTARRALREIRDNQPCSWKGISVPPSQR